MAYSPGYSNLLNTAYPQFSQYEIATGKKPRKSFAQGLLSADLYGAKKLGMEYNLRERMLAADEAYRANQLALEKQRLAQQQGQYTQSFNEMQRQQQEQAALVNKYGRLNTYLTLGGEALKLPAFYSGTKTALEDIGLLGNKAPAQTQAYDIAPANARFQQEFVSQGPTMQGTYAPVDLLGTQATLGTQTPAGAAYPGLMGGTTYPGQAGAMSPTAGMQVGAAGTDIGAQTAALASPTTGGSYTAAAPAYGAYSDAGATVGIGGGMESGGAMAGAEGGIAGTSYILPAIGAAAIAYQLFDTGKLHRVIGDLASRGAKAFGKAIGAPWRMF